MIWSAAAQNIIRVNVADNICISSNVCVEVVDTNAKILTEQFLREGSKFWIGNTLFLGSNIMPSIATSIGPIRIDGRTSFQTWVIPIYTGDKRQTVTVNKTVRVVGVPDSFVQKTTKVYQFLRGETIALVFSQNGDFRNYVRNPSPKYKYAKNTSVVICYAE